MAGNLKVDKRCSKVKRLATTEVASADQEVKEPTKTGPARPGDERDAEREKAIARLKATAEVEEQQLREDGLKAGRSWAEHKATLGELRRLQRAADVHDGCLAWDYFAPDGDETLCAGIFVETIRPARGLDARATGEFWSGVLCETHMWATDELAFVEAFAEGALDFLSEVHNEL